MEILQCLTVSAELIPWRRSPSPVARLFVERVFSETMKQINFKACGKVAIHNISKPFLFVFQTFGFFNFNELFFIFINMEPHESENFKSLPSYSYNSF